MKVPVSIISMVGSGMDVLFPPFFMLARMRVVLNSASLESSYFTVTVDCVLLSVTGNSARGARIGRSSERRPMTNGYATYRSMNPFSLYSLTASLEIWLRRV